MASAGIHMLEQALAIPRINGSSVQVTDSRDVLTGYMISSWPGSEGTPFKKVSSGSSLDLTPCASLQSASVCWARPTSRADVYAAILCHPASTQCQAALPLVADGKL